MEDGAGAESEGETVSELDARQLFQAIPLLGQKFNDTLLMRDSVPPHSSWDRMVAARFEVPESKLEARKRLVVRIEEVDGKVFDLSENRSNGGRAGLVPLPAQHGVVRVERDL